MNSKEKQGKEESTLKAALRALKTVMECTLKPRPITGETSLK
jgi:hypothetical protein